ncbi:MAG: hypothetical protein JRJ49_07590 [Deltaproteobacteria bacterium]|nr:hypothetical protein [Deltaproteobacteria bacterium]
MQHVIFFFHHPFFSTIGGLSVLLMIFSFFYITYLIIKGVFPVWYRLGIGLSKRKIAIFADNKYDSLKDILVDSKMFKEKNIIKINKDSIQKAEKTTLLLVHWLDFKSEIDEILKIKKDSDALIIYAPREEGSIEQDDLAKINLKRNSIIVNFRGRLLNDILTCMITTSYKYKKC